MSRTIFKIFLLFIFVSQVHAQTYEQTLKYRSEPYGDIQFRKEGTMDGNLVRTLFYNNGEVGQWPFSPSGEWPKGSGHNYLDGVAVLITTELNTPVGTVHPLQTSYREWMDRDPITGTIWGLEPVPGYANASSEEPAFSNNPTTWPEVWPKTLPNVDATWDGFWYGYFGRGVINSDFETFYVMDDSKDGEFSRSPYNYFPVADDHNRKGLGLRVEIRGFQWSHVLAEDIIFWHYDIVNISDNDYDSTYFGFYTDTGVGGQADNADDNASYDVELDIAYAYDSDGKGAPGSWKTGYYGYAYLESPGNPFDGIDNDGDLLVDERRDDNIDNDGDWVGYADLNGNGEWDADANEPLYNDVGKDGVGPFDPQYEGPDEGEGDGIPTDGEPNFDRTDKDESDQIGLTSLSIYRLGDGGTGGGWPKDDEQMWNRMQAANFDTSLQRSNISMVFASGKFGLKKNLRERFSMALVYGNDLEDLVFNKETVQQIYNANYNFSKPPLKPTVTAVPGDGRVFLYWDAAAEESRDPFLGYENNDPTQGYKRDFEGYLVYRSEEPEFNDIKTITDSKGDAKYWEPIAQFDLVNDISGPDPVGINGASFWRGSNTGLQHSFIDENVTNGVTYYYAIVSYDQGDPAFGTKGLTPSECTKIISEDFSGVLQFVDINCAVVTPNAPAAGYKPPELEGSTTKVTDGIGTGNLNVSILNTSAIKEGATYNVYFNSTGSYPQYETSGYTVVRSYDSQTDTLFSHDTTSIGTGKFSTPFDGMTVEVINSGEVSVIDTSTGWLIGTSNLNITVAPDESSPSRNIAWPSDYEVRFYDEVKMTTPFFNIPIKFLVINKTTNDTSDVEVFDNDNDGVLSVNDEFVILEYIGTRYYLSWRVNYYQPAGIGYQPIEPVPGDIYQIKTTKQFQAGDYFSFSTKSSSVDYEQAKTELADVTVVPNPYVAAASWEKRNLNQTGRGERRIDFINLPAECTIRIYTVAGQLVKTLYKDGAPSDGTISWNLISEDGMDISYGLYIYHLTAPEIGEHIGRFAIIK